MRAAFVFGYMIWCLTLPGTVAASEAGVISPRDLMAQIKAGKAPLILDVRSAGEYAAGHVPGARHFPFMSAYWNADELPVSGSDPVVVYCAHGPRASLAGFSLGLKGFKNVIYLKGDMVAWEEAKLPLKQGQEPLPGGHSARNRLPSGSSTPAPIDRGN